MNVILRTIASHAAKHPSRIAIESQGNILTYQELDRAVRQAARILTDSGVQRLGLAMDNGPAWAIWDLAAMRANVTVVPIGGFLSDEQKDHIVQDASVDAIIDDLGEHWTIAGYPVGWNWCKPESRTRLHRGTVKVTYTSGTTGHPKGVCLSEKAIVQVAESLLQVTRAASVDRHICLLPLSVLLENVAGLYVPLLAGARVILEPLHEVGLQGSSGLNARRMHQALLTHKASTCILVPAMLQGLVDTMMAGAEELPRMRLAAVGGGKVSGHLIEQAHSLGLQVYQGYGLSECASVVAFSSLDNTDFDTVGYPLPHLEVRIADDGEVLVKGSHFLGYTGELEVIPEWLPTGDLGTFNEKGQLIIQGRKRNILITAFGRNVSPEWIEAELLSEPEIEQAVALGDAETSLTAVIVSNAPSEHIEASITRVNHRLPDYARIGKWFRSPQVFSPENGMATYNGRPRREIIARHYEEDITV